MTKMIWTAATVFSASLLGASAAAAWDGFTDESVALDTASFSFGGTNAAAGDTNENYYDGDFGDFDGDGLLDRALISRYGLLLNTGGGIMTPVANTVPGGTYRFGGQDDIGNDAVEWVDVDSDGDLDSIQGGNGEYLRLQLNRQGRFSLKWTKSNTAKRIIGVDIERDGDVDIVVSGCFCLSRTCGLPDGFALLVNDGAGNFSDETASRGLAYGTHLVVSVVAGDIDRDGDFDLLLASGDSTGAGAAAGTSMKLLALVNDGTGDFTERAFFDIPAAVAGPSTWDAGIGMDGNGNTDLADIDADGDLDYVVSSLGPMGGHPNVYYALFANDGAGGFTEQAAARFDVGSFTGALFASRIKFVDVDHDNDFDLVAYFQGDATAFGLGSYNLQLFLNDGAGVFTFDPSAFAPLAPLSGGIMAFDVADYTGDGATDLWVGQQGGPVLAYVNTFQDPSGLPADVPRALRVISTTGGVELGFRAPPFASTVRAYRVYRSSVPGLPVPDRVLVKGIGTTAHGDESFIAPLTARTTALELNDPSVTVAPDGEIRYVDTTAVPGIGYFYSVVHVGYETKASAPTPEVSASVAPTVGADFTGPELTILSPTAQDWSAFARISLQFDDGGSGVDPATLNISFDKELGTVGAGGRAAGVNVADVFFRSDARTYVAAFTQGLRLPAGLVTMTARIDDLAGNRTTRQVAFNVDLVEQQLPTAAFSASPASGAAPLVVAFDGSASVDSDGKVVRWEWAFGDGGIGLGRNVQHTYAYGGDFTATLLVRDNEGGAAAATRAIAVTGDAPDCTTGDTRRCYPADPTTEGVGSCVAGTEACVDGAFAPCTGAVTPVDELCDGVDNDCNGSTDETFPGLGGVCTAGLGVCAAQGVVGCVGNAAACDAVQGTPGNETCDGLLDDNCDGAVDEGCPCTDGEARSCYGGPAATRGVGICVPGTQQCAGGVFGGCQGQVLPVVEACGDGLDNDCNGLADVADGCAPDEPDAGTLADAGPTEPPDPTGCGCSGGKDGAWFAALATVLWGSRRRGQRALARAEPRS